MAAYTQYNAPTSWVSNLGTSYVANTTQVVITNLDGTRTRLPRQLHRRGRKR